MITINGLSKSFGVKTITNNLNLQVEKGEFLAIIGRSGEGKSVLLKQIIGLIKPDAGTVIIDGINVTALRGRETKQIFLTCGYVFQFAALLDSLTVGENIALPIVEAGLAKSNLLETIQKQLISVGLKPDIIDRYPDELSGGMKKRVGLARTLMLKPKVLLYDEPTTGLDPITVRLIHELMRKTHDEQNATTVVISHDVEIFKFATHVAMLFEGKIIYKGLAKDIWECTNPHVHQFIRGLADGPISFV
jgi:phospholipid/cholesterol/gamma-HCH transport system ATP-binding protein